MSFKMNIGGPNETAATTLFAIVFLVCITKAYLYIRRKNVARHREWMIRAYVVTFAFVTYRLVSSWLRHWVHVPDDPVADDIDTLMAWACWAVPLLIVEPFIQLRAMRLAA